MQLPNKTLWMLLTALPAPADQPQLQQPSDCRYTIAKTPDGALSGSLDPAGCYGLDPGGSDLIYRPDFCPSASP
jgi:hypothetical protein